MKVFVGCIGVLVQLVAPVLLLNDFHGQHIILAGYNVSSSSTTPTEIMIFTHFFL